MPQLHPFGYQTPPNYYGFNPFTYAPVGMAPFNGYYQPMGIIPYGSFGSPFQPILNDQNNGAQLAEKRPADSNDTSKSNKKTKVKHRKDESDSDVENSGYSKAVVHVLFTIKKFVSFEEMNCRVLRAKEDSCSIENFAVQLLLLLFSLDELQMLI